MPVLDEAAVLQRDGIRAALGGLARAVQDQQAAGVARLGRSLGDQLVGQLVIEIIGAHGAPPSSTASIESQWVSQRPIILRYGQVGHDRRASRARARSSAASAAEKRHPQ